MPVNRGYAHTVVVGGTGMLLAAPGRPPLFVHVVGSARSRLIDVADVARERLVASGAAVAYRQVVLGARPSGGTMRWLTHEEISRGMVDVIDSEQERFVVGAVPAG